MNKKILFLILSVLLCLVLIITGITVGRMGTQSGDGTETPKPPVTITPPKPDTLPPSADTSSPETAPPPPYAGKTFTILAPDDGELLLGDSAYGDAVSEAVYERNLAVCRETGVTLLFKYSLDLYGDIEKSKLSGSESPDLLMLNMREDGSRFLMNGGLSDVSALYESETGLDADFNSEMRVANKQFFILGELTPSSVLARHYLKVKADSSAAELLINASKGGELTYDALFEVLADVGASLSLNAQGLHAMLSEGIFSLSDSGEADVYLDGYVSGAVALSAYSAQINADTEAEICVGTYSGDGYVYLPLPRYEGRGEGTAADMSRLFPLALTDDCRDTEMSFFILLHMIRLSSGLTELAISEYKLPKGASPVYCLYDIFGWGDFSEHAYKALTKNKAESLEKTLEAPKRASLQALSILFERNS